MNDEFAVEQNRGDLDALEQIAQIGVGAVELVDLAVEFGVDRVQLFVNRLQLLLGRSQLLVGILEFLIDRNHFLVRSLELLQCTDWERSIGRSSASKSTNSIDLSPVKR